MTTANKPHPLKGIVNTNDDPMACALCYHPIHDWEESAIMVCCGKDLCNACLPNRETVAVCPLCKSSYGKGTRTATTLKKQAKKGAPWAQYMLASAYRDGDGVRQSYEDANRWQEKASKSGHPFSTLNIGISFLFGHGRRVDLSKATQFLRLALSRGATHTKCHSALLLTAEQYVHMGTPEATEEARSILQFLLLEEPNTHTANTHALLGRTYANDGDYPTAYKQYVLSASMSKKKEVVAMYAMLCKGILGHHAQGRFWLGKVTISKLAFETDENRKLAITDVISYRRELRQLRDICGGCGAEFEGKDRKFCRGCRAYCYCSRECQKMHWNRKDNGHREDCLGLKDLKQKLKEAKRNSDLIG